GTALQTVWAPSWVPWPPARWTWTPPAPRRSRRTWTTTTGGPVASLWRKPGETANRSRWRYDLKRGLVGPGPQTADGGTQVEMPEEFDYQRAKGFHMLASPPGTAAPLDHINTTPDTGEVHDRGQMAPVDKLNYTLLPSGQFDAMPYTGGAGSPQPMPFSGAAPQRENMGAGQGMSMQPGSERIAGRYAEHSA